MSEVVTFAVGAGGALLGAMGVVLSKSPLRSALWLIATLCSSALLYITLDGPFVAAVQILVYAGAIMVLFVFVIMLLNLDPKVPARPAYLSLAKLMGGCAILYLGGRLVTAVLNGPGAVGPARAPVLDGSVAAVGVDILTSGLFGFEAISVLLLVAVVGAVVLGLERLT